MTYDADAHALGLLQDVAASGTWTGAISVVDIDSVCRFGPDGAKCNRLLDVVVVLQKGDEVSVLALCTEHGDTMKRALERWRGMS